MKSGTEYTLEELALHAKSLYRLTMDFGINTCILCKVQDKSDGQIKEFDDSWGFLCGSCELKLAEKLKKKPVTPKFPRYLLLHVKFVKVLNLTLCLT